MTLRTDMMPTPRTQASTPRAQAASAPRTGAARARRVRAAWVRYTYAAWVPCTRAARVLRSRVAGAPRAYAASAIRTHAASAPRARAAWVRCAYAAWALCTRTARALPSRPASAPRAYAASTPCTHAPFAPRARAARPLLPVVGLLLPVLVLFAMFGAATAQAADGYRYWSFWQRDGGGWSYAAQGPSSARPGDGDMIGFRYAVSEDSNDATRPRGMADFAAVCADTPATDGTKRVAVVIDFGTATDAPDRRTPPTPRTECARVGEDASAGEALAAVAKPLRYNSAALLCAISGYPETGCGDKVSTSVDDHAAPKGDGGKADGGSGPSAGLIGGLAAVVLLGAAAVWQARRRRV